MDQTASVRVIQRVADPPRDAHGLVDRRRRLVGEGLATDQLHHEERRALGLVDVVDRDERRMVQRRRGACLAQQSLAPGRVAACTRDDLDGDVTVELAVSRAEHDAHSTSADALHESVSIGQRLAHVEARRELPGLGSPVGGSGEVAAHGVAERAVEGSARRDQIARGLGETQHAFHARSQLGITAGVEQGRALLGGHFERAPEPLVDLLPAIVHIRSTSGFRTGSPTQDIPLG